MNLTNEEVLQAVTDAFGALAIALSRQIDAKQLATDLRDLSDEAQASGHGASAGLIGEIARAVETRTAQPN